jgi:hypothetical protein
MNNDGGHALEYQKGQREDGWALQTECKRQQLTSMRPNCEEMKGLGLGRWMLSFGNALSQPLSKSEGTGSCENSV